MNTSRSHRQSVLGPLLHKSFRVALAAELSRHIPTLGTLTAQALADHLEHLFEAYFPKTQRMRMGQVLWPAVAKDQTGGYGKRIEDTRLQPVLLSLITAQDLADSIRGVSKKQLRKKIAARLFDQAFEQGGVLTLADVATLLGLDPSTISYYVKEYEGETGRTVPRRGTVHDLGPTLSHKRQICYRVIVQGRSIEDTARDTHHSVQAVTRYVNAYRRVFHCLANGFSLDQTAFATGLSKSLVQQYADLKDQHQCPTSSAGTTLL